ncbi:hypothetical protein [Limosilactobacillus reuteri]|uniref:Uncharacterized protein n=1 Tax=Limosilactobacillus reuteri subsp. rodentium (strain DSM 17509 / CIP 109821 / 100-23) TaxID=349123 RepID=B3XPH5_LIMR1|nr:hypothetical protein [Limosilactobacillus reuteri]EDX43618.1 hypothetical protein Lreu23DRAFT_5143 [Limosilactobacillus reuteri subsp. rodentium]MCC4474782.1 hypothetical protein [Limosilactobacillus reuteri]
MTEQNEIIISVFKNKASDFKKHAFTARPCRKNQCKETNSLFWLQISKAVIRYAR